MHIAASLIVQADDKPSMHMSDDGFPTIGLSMFTALGLSSAMTLGEKVAYLRRLAIVCEEAAEQLDPSGNSAHGGTVVVPMIRGDVSAEAIAKAIRKAKRGPDGAA